MLDILLKRFVRERKRVDYFLVYAFLNQLHIAGILAEFNLNDCYVNNLFS